MIVSSTPEKSRIKWKPDIGHDIADKGILTRREYGGDFLLISAVLQISSDSDRVSQ